MRDPYQVLGLSRAARAEEIKLAFRRLAKSLHPDLNPGKAESERRFKEINQAYALIGDPVRRARFDRGELDSEGEETPFYQSYADAEGGEKYWRGVPESKGGVDLGDVFAEFFDGDSIADARARRPRRGQDVTYRLTVTLVEVAQGARKRVRFAEDRDFDIVIPEGAEEGLTLSLPGQGLPGAYGGETGNAHVVLSLAPDPHYRRQADDLHVDLPVTLAEAVGGAQVTLPTPRGSVTLKVPADSNAGRVLRLKSRGLFNRRSGSYGDLFAHLVIVLPDKADPALKDFVATWIAPPQDPRKKAGLA